MELAAITFEQVTVLFLLIFTGALCSRLGVLPPEARKLLSDLLLYLVVPAMVVNSYMTGFDPSTGRNLLHVFGWSLLAEALGLGLTLLLTRRRQGGNWPVVRFGCIFSNAAYMGFPLIQALFGDEGLLYASAYVTVFNVLLWTVGLALLDRSADRKEILRSIAKTPVLYAVLLGMVLYFGQVPVPELLQKPCALLGSMNTPLSMLITGMLIASCDLRSLLKNAALWFAVALRLLVIPALCIGVFALAGFGGMPAQVVLLLEACPSAAVTSILAVRYRYEEQFAAGLVVITTLLSILTLPLTSMLLTHLL